MNFATDQNMMLHPAIVIAPQCPEKMSWSNFSRGKSTSDIRLQAEPTKPMELLIGLIHQLMRTMPVDSSRIYITGLSMGGFGTYDAIERYPDLFAAAVPVCGGGDPTKSFVHRSYTYLDIPRCGRSCGKSILFFGYVRGIHKTGRSSRNDTIP